MAIGDLKKKLDSRAKVAPTQKQFWDSVYKAARAKGAKFPELVAAQAALESGWGSRESGRFNYFGQKATRSQEGRDVTTQEEVGGRRVKMLQRFRDYNSIDEAISDHLRLWQPKYALAKDARAAARLLQTGERRYATDSKYVDTVEKILKMQGY
jgi:flagellum-specific peptidoglycan hydrolase FlgJ